MKTKSFILVAVAVSAVLVGGFLYVALSGGSDERRAGALRSYTVGNWYLEVGGTPAGQLRGVSGCGVAAEVSMEPPLDKRPGGTRFGPCEISFGTGVGAAGWQWIAEAAQGTGAPQNVALVHVDASGVADFQLNLTEAWIARFALPALDASSNETAIFRARIEAQKIERAKASTTPKPVTSKTLLVANYRLTIPGLDTTKILGIDSWEFALVGSQGEKGTELPKPDLSNLTVLTSETTVKGYEDYLLAALASIGPVAEKSATLDILNSDLKSTALQIDFGGVGIIAGELFGASEASGTPAKRQYSFYVESATIKSGF